MYPFQDSISYLLCSKLAMLIKYIVFKHLLCVACINSLNDKSAVSGFVGLFTILFLWPGLLILHFAGAEKFEWPDPIQWLFLVANGVIGTVLSELLWLW